MKNFFAERARKLPKHLYRDGAKWLMVPSKIILDGLSVWPEHQNFLTAIVHTLVVITQCFVIAGNLYYISRENVGLGSIAYALSILMVTVESMVRRILMYSYKDQLQKLLSKIYFEFWPSTMAGSKLHQELVRASRYLFIYCSGYTFIAFLCGLQYIMVPYFNGNLPLRTAYPLSWKKSPYYELLYVWQSFLSVELALNVCAVDWFFVSVLFNCVAQFKLLRVYLEKNFEKIIRKPDRSPAEAMQFLVFCIRKHNHLLCVCNEIEQLFKYFLLIQFLTSIGTVCLSGFTTTVNPEDVGTSLTFLIGHLSEILVYCYMGNDLTLESTELSKAAFQCGWHLSYAEQDLQKTLVLIMVRAQKPIKISAGGFAYLSLPSFVKLIQFSFSVYTLLNSMLKKQRTE